MVSLKTRQNKKITDKRIEKRINKSHQPTPTTTEKQSCWLLIRHNIHPTNFSKTSISPTSTHKKATLAGIRTLHIVETLKPRWRNHHQPTIHRGQWSTETSHKKVKRHTMHQNQHKGWSTKYLNLVHHAIEFSNNLRTQQTHHTVAVTLRRITSVKQP